MRNVLESILDSSYECLNLSCNFGREDKEAGDSAGATDNFIVSDDADATVLKDGTAQLK